MSEIARNGDSRRQLRVGTPEGDWRTLTGFPATDPWLHMSPQKLQSIREKQQQYLGAMHGVTPQVGDSGVGSQEMSVEEFLRNAGIGPGASQADVNRALYGRPTYRSEFEVAPATEAEPVQETGRQVRRTPAHTAEQAQAEDAPVAGSRRIKRSQRREAAASQELIPPVVDSSDSDGTQTYEMSYTDPSVVEARQAYVNSPDFQTMLEQPTRRVGRIARRANARMAQAEAVEAPVAGTPAYEPRHASEPILGRRAAFRASQVDDSAAAAPEYEPRRADEQSQGRRMQRFQQLRNETKAKSDFRAVLNSQDTTLIYNPEVAATVHEAIDSLVQGGQEVMTDGQAFKTEFMNKIMADAHMAPHADQIRGAIEGMQFVFTRSRIEGDYLGGRSDVGKKIFLHPDILGQYHGQLREAVFYELARQAVDAATIPGVEIGVSSYITQRLLDSDEFPSTFKVHEKNQTMEIAAVSTAVGPENFMREIFSGSPDRMDKLGAMFESSQKMISWKGFADETQRNFARGAQSRTELYSMMTFAIGLPDFQNLIDAKIYSEAQKRIGNTPDQPLANGVGGNVTNYMLLRRSPRSFLQLGGHELATVPDSTVLGALRAHDYMYKAGLYQTKNADTRDIARYLRSSFGNEIYTELMGSVEQARTYAEERRHDTPPKHADPRETLTLEPQGNLVQPRPVESPVVTPAITAPPVVPARPAQAPSMPITTTESGAMYAAPPVGSNIPTYGADTRYQGSEAYVPKGAPRVMPAPELGSAPQTPVAQGSADVLPQRSALYGQEPIAPQVSQGFVPLNGRTTRTGYQRAQNATNIRKTQFPTPQIHGFETPKPLKDTVEFRVPIGLTDILPPKAQPMQQMQPAPAAQQPSAQTQDNPYKMPASLAERLGRGTGVQEPRQNIPYIPTRPQQTAEQAPTAQTPPQTAWQVPSGLTNVLPPRAQQRQYIPTAGGQQRIPYTPMAQQPAAQAQGNPFQMPQNVRDFMYAPRYPEADQNNPFRMPDNVRNALNRRPSIGHPSRTAPTQTSSGQYVPYAPQMPQWGQSAGTREYTPVPKGKFQIFNVAEMQAPAQTQAQAPKQATVPEHLIPKKTIAQLVANEAFLANLKAVNESLDRSNATYDERMAAQMRQVQEAREAQAKRNTQQPGTGSR